MFVSNESERTAVDILNECQFHRGSLQIASNVVCVALCSVCIFGQGNPLAPRPKPASVLLIHTEKLELNDIRLYEIDRIEQDNLYGFFLLLSIGFMCHTVSCGAHK